MTAAVLLLGSTAPVAKPAHPSAVGRLAGTTVVSFHGQGAIRLTAPASRLRGEDIELAMTSGSYAFVRLVQPADNRCSSEVGTRCHTFRFDWIDGYTTALYSDRPAAYQHMASVTDPPIIDGPNLDVYVITDGWGELTIRTLLPGRTSYWAGGRFAGRGGALRLTCEAGCTDDRATLRYAGLEYDLGPTGWAQVMVVSRNRDGVNGTAGFSGAEACLSPNPASTDASPDPADHPYGCGVPPYSSQREYVDAAYGLADLALNLPPTTANGAMVFWTAARGHQYLGGRAVVSGVEARSIQVFAIAFRYGIR